MALHLINRDVPQLQKHQIDADEYHVEGDFIHFLDEEGVRVMTIHKSGVQLIERQ